MMANVTLVEESRPPVQNLAQGTRWKAVAAGAAIVTAITFGFHLLYFNRFAGIMDANGSGLVGSLILKGRLPYRDFYYPVPPLFALENTFWTWLCGSALIVLRIVGLFERAALALTLFFWLARLFRVSSATLGAIVAIVVSTGDSADAISSYTHDALLWAIVAGLFASTCIDWKSRHWASIAAFLCGVSAGLCFCGKQTVGVGITFAVPVLVVASLWRAKGFRIASRFAACFCAGWVIPVGAVSLWLYSNGILSLCLHQIFIKGPSAKAGAPFDFLSRFFIVAFGFTPTRISFLIAFILLILTVKFLFYPVASVEHPRRNTRALVCVALLSIASIGIGVAAAYAGLAAWEPLLRASIYFTLLTCGLLAVVFSMAFVFEHLSQRQQHYWLLATVGFVCAFMLSLSWPSLYVMVFPGLGFFVAAFLDLPSRRTRTACYLVSAVLLVSLVVLKMRLPYAFNDWAELPVMSANTTSSLPELWGLRMPAPEAAILDGTAKIIREHSTPHDTIFVYPSMPIFYVLSGRGWPGYAVGHEIDACPDSIASADAAKLLAAKPAVIIYYRWPPEYFQLQEGLWRDGRRSGQRDLAAAVETLIKNYKLAASYPALRGNLTLDVYVRN